jgi:HAMP domain-containing protein
MTDVGGTVGVVRRAFLTAALVGLGIALGLALLLAGALLRRLRRLQDAAGRLALGSAHPVPDDDRRDEVGELTRAFAAMQRRIRQEQEARDSFVSTMSTMRASAFTAPSSNPCACPRSPRTFST